MSVRGRARKREGGQDRPGVRVAVLEALAVLETDGVELCVLELVRLVDGEDVSEIPVGTVVVQT